jgi:hypothetical protein
MDTLVLDLWKSAEQSSCWMFLTSPGELSPLDWKNVPCSTTQCHLLNRCLCLPLQAVAMEGLRLTEGIESGEPAMMIGEKFLVHEGDHCLGRGRVRL